MIPDELIPTHPGTILLEEFLKPAGISVVAFAKHVGVPRQRIHEIVHGKRGITPDTAWRFAQALGTTPVLWMNLQTAYELARCQPVAMVERMHQFPD